MLSPLEWNAYFRSFAKISFGDVMQSTFDLFAYSQQVLTSFSR